MRKCLSTLLFLLLADSVYAQVAVMPYRIDNPSKYFQLKTGEDYAKLLSVALSIRKDIDVTSPRDVAIDMRRLSLDSQGIITGSSLELMGRGGYLDYILLGTLKRVKGEFISESALYSIKEKRIIADRRNRSGDLTALAEGDINEIFLRVPNRASAKASTLTIGVTVLIDMSYNMSREWGSVRQGVEDFIGSLSDGWNFNTRVSIVPFSSSHPDNRVVKYLNTPLKLKRGLESLNPKGSNSAEILESALSFSVRNISYRECAKKIILLIINTPVKGRHFIERHMIYAKRNGIRVFVVSLGNVNWEASSGLRSLAITGRGAFFPVTYHQKLFDLKGRGIDLVYEAGRLFQLMGRKGRWEMGVFRGAESGDFKPHAGIDPVFEEKLYDDKKYSINPYTMAKHYTGLTGVSVINPGRVGNNTGSVLSNIVALFFKGSGAVSERPSIGKVLVSDGGLSIWIRIADRKKLDFFRKAHSSGFYTTIGIVLKKKPDEPYGIAVNPVYLITDITGDYIPDMIRTDLRRLIKDPDFYLENGLFRPPVWFIKVKVERVEGTQGEMDIRDSDN